MTIRTVCDNDGCKSHYDNVIDSVGWLRLHQLNDDSTIEVWHFCSWACLYEVSATELKLEKAREEALINSPFFKAFDQIRFPSIKKEIADAYDKSSD